MVFQVHINWIEIEMKVIIISVQEDITRKILIKHNFSEDIKALLIEIDF